MEKKFFEETQKKNSLDAETWQSQPVSAVEDSTIMPASSPQQGGSPKGTAEEKLGHIDWKKYLFRLGVYFASIGGLALVIYILHLIIFALN